MRNYEENPEYYLLVVILWATIITGIYVVVG